MIRLPMLKHLSPIIFIFTLADDLHLSPMMCTAPTVGFQKFMFYLFFQTLGDLNIQRTFRSEHKQWFWDLRPLS